MNKDWFFRIRFLKKCGSMAMVYELIEWSSFFGFCPSPNLKHSTKFRKSVLLPSSGKEKHLKFVCPCIASIIVNDDQKDANILAYLFIPCQLYMFRAMSSPIIRSTWLYLQLLILTTDIPAGWYQPAAIPEDNVRSCKYSQVLLMIGEDIAPNV